MKSNFVDLLEQIILTIPHYVFWKDRHLVYQGCNINFANMIGFNDPGDIIGKSDLELPWGKYTSDIYQEEDQYILSSGNPILDKEVPMLTNKGEEKLLSVSKVPLHDQANQIVGILGIYWDVTKQKHQEAQLKALSQAKSRFIANMSHDIRTPLTGMLGMANIILSKTDNPELKEAASYLVQATHQLMNLLNEILEITEIENGRLTIYDVKFNLHEQINNIVEMIKPSIQAKNLDLRIIYDAELPQYIIGDPMRLHRILLNLISNAIKFTEKGYIELKLATLTSTTNEPLLKIRIKDTGVGISNEDKEIIFSRFSRLTPSFNGIYSGAGLGLAIVKQFITDLQGEIQVESEKDKGSCFTCLIPFRRALIEDTSPVNQLEEIIPIEANRAPYTSTHFSSAIGNTRQQKKLQALLIEDNKIARLVAQTLLTDLGCCVDVAESGSQALQLAEQYQYDLILVDIGLPDMDGRELSSNIRQSSQSKNKESIIVALTAYADQKNSNSYFEAGMQKIFIKPLAEIQAKELIDQLVKNF